MKPHGAGGSGGGLQTHRFLRRCASRRRNLVPFALLGIIFLAMNPTVGRLWRGTRRCAGENWARVGDHTYELGESLLTLQALGFHPSAVLDIGANEGNWARSIHEKLPAASIFMIEGSASPSPKPAAPPPPPPPAQSWSRGCPQTRRWRRSCSRQRPRSACRIASRSWGTRRRR